MTFRRRGPVTRNNSVFNLKAGTVACPLSTNKWTEDEYFTIDIEKFEEVEGRTWYSVITGRVRGDNAEDGCRYDVRTRRRSSDKNQSKCHDSILHHVLFWEEANAIGLEVDHVLHWTDNRRSSVQFIPPALNKKLGAALFHHGKKNRRSKVA